MTPDRVSIFIRIRDGITWRVHRLLGERLFYGSLIESARCWRALLRKPVYIGVTGSAGKTTTKELLVGMLAQNGGGVGNRSSYNNLEEIAKATWRLRPTHRFFVTELSGHRPNEMDRPMAFLRPSIGIVTVVKDDHQTAFSNSSTTIAEEKSKLIALLPPTGTAVLNADDDLVLAMANRCSANVITYGLSPQAGLRARNVRSLWPDRLAFDLDYQGQSLAVQTQMCGTHWIPAVLGAIGGSLAAGMTLQESAQSIAKVPPFDGRMQPVTTADGITFVRDDFKAPIWTIEACFDFMRAAQAKRKIIVIGTLSDAGPGSATTVYSRIARQAREISDITVFVGPWASHVLKERKTDAKNELHVFGQVRDAQQFINSVAREGDLVLLKGTNKQDHLLRVILGHTGDVACWRDNCKRELFCNECPDRTKPSGVSAPTPAAASTTDEPGIAEPRVQANEWVIAGLGNPEPEYAGTPHNVGYAFLDALATSLQLDWRAHADAWIARGVANGQPVCLVKARIAMNHTGTVLKKLAGQLSFHTSQCVLVYDDLDTPLGTVRSKLRGGAAGHRGVASVLEAFQTADIRRVKFGVKPAGELKNRAAYVLAPLPVEDLEVISSAFPEAERQILAVIGSRASSPQKEQSLQE